MIYSFVSLESNEESDRHWYSIMNFFLEFKDYCFLFYFALTQTFQITKRNVQFLLISKIKWRKKNTIYELIHYAKQMNLLREKRIESFAFLRIIFWCFRTKNSLHFTMPTLCTFFSSVFFVFHNPSDTQFYPGSERSSAGNVNN